MVLTKKCPSCWSCAFVSSLCLIYCVYCQVIGDKMGGVTSRTIANPDNENILEQLSEVVKVPIKFIHVTRNPFDNIATIMLRATHLRDKVRREGADEVRKVKG